MNMHLKVSFQELCVKSAVKHVKKNWESAQIYFNLVIVKAPNSYYCKE